MKPGVPTDPLVLEQVCELTAAGWSAARIAAHLRCSARSVQRFRARLGISKPAPNRLTLQQLERARQLIDDGAPTTEITATTGISHTHLRRLYPRRRDHVGSQRYRAMAAALDQISGGTGEPHRR